MINWFKRTLCLHPRKIIIACCHEHDDFGPWEWAGAQTGFCPDCLWIASHSTGPGDFVALLKTGFHDDIISPWVPTSMRELLLIYLRKPRDRVAEEEAQREKSSESQKDLGP